VFAAKQDPPSLASAKAFEPISTAGIVPAHS
jgi:hypothetical protein